MEARKLDPQPIPLFRNRHADERFFKNFHSIVLIHDPLGKRDHRALSGAQHHFPQLSLQLAAHAELPPQWLKEEVEIVLTGPGVTLRLQIQDIVERWRDEFGFFMTHVRTWAVQPISLGNFEDVHFVTKTGHRWSSKIAPLL